MEYANLRITKLRQYLFDIIDTLVASNTYQINADMLSDDINNYSLDKIPTDPQIEKWVDGTEIHRDLFSFRSRNEYSQDTISNLLNIGFFEIFEASIRDNNNRGNLPDITGIQKIECLNCGTMVSSETNTAEFDIQIQITYIVNKTTPVVSL